jgi:uncharacterized protein (TIGR02646 family)
MIRIDKPDAAPDKLRTDGKNERRRLSNLYTHHADAYDAGARTFEFKSHLYGHETVKAALIRAQHGKCAFCESKVTHIAYGDVEHYRPKKGYRQQPGDPLGRPGYYWLAYEWSNLLFACQLCNQRHKRNLFPLSDPTQRARSHHDEIEKEDPLFVHPAADEPEEHISFREEMAFPIDNDRRAKVTIEALGLNRAVLSEKRRDHLEELELIYMLAQLDPPIPESARAQEYLQRAIQDKAEYAAMARAALASDFQV